MKGGPHDGPDPGVIETIVTLLAAGAFLETAAATAGITSRTLRNWLRYAREGDERFQPAAAAILEACAAFEHVLIERVRWAADTDWKAAAWLLEKRFPKRWGSIAQGEDIDGEDDRVAFDWQPSKTDST